MENSKITYGLIALGLIGSTAYAQSLTNEVSITSDSDYIYIESNGIPNHETGEFPNAGNPNTISEQEQSFKVPANPTTNSSYKDLHLAGIALNGILFEPGTGESYENSRDWRYEALQDTMDLGLDDNNAHVQPTGKYHYHGIPYGLIETLDDSSDMIHVGYAADGFKFYYSQSGFYDSSYQLKSGTRSSGPGGEYDGTFTADFEYVDGLGELDECNATTYNGELVYVMTEEFPYISRCLWGTMDSTFQTGGGGGQSGEQGQMPPMDGQDSEGMMSGERPPMGERPGMQEENSENESQGERPPRENDTDMVYPEATITSQKGIKGSNYKTFTGTLKAAITFEDQDEIENEEAVETLQRRGIMEGNPDGTFAPTKGINRAESIKTLLEALSIDVSETTTNPFSDVDKTQWYASYIATAKSEGIVSGNPDGSFRPGSTTNQAELLKMTLETFGIELRAATSSEQWYAPYIEYAIETGIIDEENPAEEMTREDFAEMVYRLIIQQESL